MKLVIGGYAQGKLTYVLQKYHIRESDIYDAALPQRATSLHSRETLSDPQDKGSAEALSPTIVINHFHAWVKQRIMGGGCPEKEITSFLESCENCIIISDEIGNGIVPVDAWERAYRERTGRILVELAGKATEVERIICGIGQKIK